MEGRRALLEESPGGGPRSDQTVEVSRLELMGVLRQSREVTDTEVTRPRAENTAEGQCAQCRVPTGTTPVNQQGIGVRPSRVDEVLGGVHAVVEVNDAPRTLQSFAVRPAVPRASAVVNVHHGKTATSPILNRVAQCRITTRGRATMAGHNKWRGPARRGFRIPSLLG